MFSQISLAAKFVKTGVEISYKLAEKRFRVCTFSADKINFVVTAVNSLYKFILAVFYQSMI